MTIIKYTEKGKEPQFYSQVLHSERIDGVSKPLFSAYKLINIQEGNPRYSWEGGKISLSLWKQITAFFEHTQRLHKCESQVRLYYNKRTEVWAAWAYPQKLGTGMFTKEVTGGNCPLADRRDRERAQFGADWEEFGTVHHHCEAGAFQSSTDSADERNRSGLHITVGHITKNKYDLDWRVTFKQGTNILFYSARGLDLSEWFELPADLAQVPAKYRAQIDEEKAITEELKKPDPLVPFPEEWKNNLIEPDPVKTYASQGGYHPGYGDDYGYQQPGFRGGGFSSTRTDTDKVIRYIHDHKDVYDVDLEQFAYLYLAVRQLPGVTTWDIGQAAEAIVRNDIRDALTNPALNDLPFLGTGSAMEKERSLKPKGPNEDDGKTGKTGKMPGKHSNK
jgi:hypothetical protein